MSEAERAGTSRQDTRQDDRERLLAGRYRLGGVLGRGGMGTVWRAVDETLGRTVAVKELRFPSNIDEEEKRRLITRTLREAKAIARIRNNSAVTVFDVVEEDDRPWIVMELVEGKSLAEVIREDGLLEPKRAAEVGLAVLDVLRSAHREGILHRDVKPSNVLLESDTDRVVLTDFGIAQVEGDPSITSTGMLVGAPSYISPERARGHKPGPAADLWSLGGLLYASVEGVPPYDKGSAIATLTAVMTEPMEEPKNAGPLRDVIYGLLTKDPEKRLDDAGARAMLNAVIHAPKAEPEPVDATKVVPLPPQPDAPEGKGRSGAGSKRGEEAGERFRGALRSVRKAAAGAGAAGTAAARAKSGGETAVSQSGGAAAAGSSTGVGGAGASSKGGSTGRPSGAGASGVAAASGAGAGAGDRSGAGERGAESANGQSGGRSSGWPVMTPPDLPPRPVPRAPLTDVVPKRTLVIIAVAVALVVLGVVLALTLGDDGGSKASANGGGGKASAKASASADTKTDENDRTQADGEKSASATAGSGSGEGAETGSTPSAGPSATGGSGAEAGSGSDSKVVKTHKGSQGYSIGLPKGWKLQSTDSAGDRFTGPDGQKLLVAWTSTPKGDPVADWKNQERGMVRSQYKRIRIEEVDYRGWNTADWEFTYVEGGTKYRTIDRGFVVNDQLGHALMYTAKDSNWDSELRKDTWKTLTDSFKPKS
ncbi:serine/threonine protein kinase [Streptomyces viridochromogenes]|uniref:non-specific serine/threonine protein kinase n=1 Tax=Streptomyces viridochromogenes TaxID=1938 RepID=A0A0J7Z4A5_STRVR|nr:serine/threonine-protein kinase [Streptomyces viridochromogenes]KMS70377.1 serine/threonine protein kinase [Streptomyces viridochromogenes]KOG19448.1 serine/threonine protein kinase [Streptomyces viridochromogenes]KOG19946.1 serine/threonine protein kinase [Streptomyces viridochromogenes]